MALPKLNAARYTTIIPSTGKEIDYRPYLVKEEKILMLAMESQDQQQIVKAIKDVLSNCIYDDVNVDKLAMFDLEYLFLMLRSKSVGENVELKAKCEHCEEQNEVSLNISNIKPPQNAENSNVIELTKNIGITIRYPTIKDIEKFKEDDLKSMEGLTKLIVQLIDTIYDEDNVYDASTQSQSDLMEFIDGFSTEQFLKVASFFEKLPTLKHNLEFNCTSCGAANNIELKGLQSFFS